MKTTLLFILCILACAQTPDAELQRGLALAKSDQLDAANTTLLRARRAYPHDPRFPLELAGIAYRQQNPAQSKHLLREALRLDPANEYGNTFLGALYLLDGNLPATIKYWNRVHKPLLQQVHLKPIPALHPLLRDRALWLSGGQVLTTKNLEMTTANLESLAAFSTYQFELTPANDNRYDLTFRSLTKRLPTSKWMSLLPLARGLPYQTVFLDFQNIRQRAMHFDSLIRWDPNKKRLAFNLTSPWRLSPHWIWRLGVDARDEDWDLTPRYGIDGPQLRKAALTAGVTHSLTSRLEWGLHFQSAKRSYRNAGSSSYFRNGWSVELANSLDALLWTRPENRMKLTAGVAFRTGHLYSSQPSHYSGIDANSRFTWLPAAKGDDLVVSATTRAGNLFGAPPFDELYILGMERDNDIWMRGHAGTRNGRKGSAPLGARYGIVQSEVDRTVLRFPLVRLQLGPFLDTGRITDPHGVFGSRTWLVDAGAQAKLRVLGGFTWAFVYGRDLRQGTGVFYTAIVR
ncbi:MAG: hypothetical protein JST93_31840 [Acidobacteria bacterium]|nr:hypothetical protein [Acidobacteriota bacterium]